MSSDNQKTVIGTIIGSAVAFLVTAYVAASETVFALAGRETTAEVTQSFETQSKRGRFGSWRTSGYKVEYQFQDHTGRVRTGSDKLGRSGAADAEADTVRVVYRPGLFGGSSRMVGNFQWVEVIVFFVSGAILAFFVGKMYLESRAGGGSKKKKKKRARPLSQDEEDDMSARRHL